MRIYIDDRENRDCWGNLIIDYDPCCLAPESDASYDFYNKRNNNERNECLEILKLGIALGQQGYTKNYC